MIFTEIKTFIDIIEQVVMIFTQNKIVFSLLN
jgi:hypothetical protein